MVIFSILGKPQKSYFISGLTPPSSLVVTFFSKKSWLSGPAFTPLPLLLVRPLKKDFVASLICAIFCHKKTCSLDLNLEKCRSLKKPKRIHDFSCCCFFRLGFLLPNLLYLISLSLPHFMQLSPSASTHFSLKQSSYTVQNITALWRKSTHTMYIHTTKYGTGTCFKII